METSPEKIIEQTIKWITDVVIGCNFCPFAAREIKQESIYYEVVSQPGAKPVLEALSATLSKMDNTPGVETALIILPKGFETFLIYLQLIETAEDFIISENYEGVYQAASFHPQYLFAGSNENDPANYTNRSPYPMLHILREESVSRAVDSHPNVDDIPEKNIAFATKKGLAAMQALRNACMT